MPFKLEQTGIDMKYPKQNTAKIEKGPACIPDHADDKTVLLAYRLIFAHKLIPYAKCCRNIG